MEENRRTAVWRRFLVAILILLICCCYLIIALPRPTIGVNGYTAEFYALLARNLLQGKTWLPIAPRPELLRLSNPYDPVQNTYYRLHDASLYGGRYYLYFGIVPAVTLFAPYHLLTHGDLPNRVAVPIFCIVGFLCSCALFFVLARRNRWELPPWLQRAVIIALGTMSAVSLLLRRPSFYEVAIAGGYCFAMAGFLALGRAVLVSEGSLKWVVLASLMFGLTVGCRPHLVVICAVVFVAYAIRARRQPRLVMAMATGMAICGAGLAWYNYARFDDPLEFGRSYQLTLFSPTDVSSHYGVKFNGRWVVRAAARFLLVPPRPRTWSPYLEPMAVSPLPKGYARIKWTEDMVGLIPAAPFALFGCCLPLFLWRRRDAGGSPLGVPTDSLDEASRWLMWVIYWSALAVFLVLCAVGWVLGRYIVDFGPLLAFDGVVIAVLLLMKTPEGRGKRFFGLVFSLAVFYGVLVNAAIALSNLQVYVNLQPK